MGISSTLLQPKSIANYYPDNHFFRKFYVNWDTFKLFLVEGGITLPTIE